MIALTAYYYSLSGFVNYGAFPKVNKIYLISKTLLQGKKAGIISLLGATVDSKVVYDLGLDHDPDKSEINSISC